MNKFIIYAIFASIVFNTSLLFSEETSSQPEGTAAEQAIREEIRWLQAEAFALDVTLSSRKPEKLSEATAAIYVITQENIRRSGVTSIPEALRMVPGLQVARINANRWAVTSRGFNGTFANKLLVLIDGRSVYTPLYSGIYWDVQNLLLEDVERIEVIRGPGGALWGANAVNGIINIMTKNSKDTQGGLLTEMVGSEERNVSGVRYGGKIGKEAFYRIYARYLNHDDFVIASSSDDSNDNWQNSQGGMRIDWDLSAVDSLMLKGDIYDGDVNQLSDRSLQRQDKDVSGVNFMGRWKHAFSDDSDMYFQTYYDHTYRRDAFFREKRNTFDLDLQHRFMLGSLNELIWGLGYRYTSDDFNTFSTFDLNPDREGDNLFSVFIQDKVSLFNDRLQLTIGTKLEHNDYTGIEVQPNARILWRLAERHRVWAAVSRAVRTPNRSEHDMVNNTGRIIVLGSGNFVSEDILAYEIGYRVQPIESLSIDIAAFSNDYDNLETSEEGGPISNLPTIIEDNKMDGETFGLEVSTNWNVTDSWKIIAGYTFLQMQLHLDQASTNIGRDVKMEGKSPQNQGYFQSYLDLPYDLEFDTSLNYVDHLSSLDVPSYLKLNVRVGWRPTESLDISVGVRDLLDDDHLEFRGIRGLVETEIERSVYARLTWRF